MFIRHISCDVGQHFRKFFTKLFLEVDDCIFITEKLQRAPAFSLQQGPHRSSFISFILAVLTVVVKHKAHLSHITGCILQVQLVENTEDVILVLPGRWLHQQFRHPLLLEMFPSEQRTVKSCIFI